MKRDVAQPLPSWRVVAASATGRRHVQQRQPCQDAVRWELSSKGWLFAAVADGAGSARLGELGATTAAAAALAAVRQQFAGREPLGFTEPTGAHTSAVQAAGPPERGLAVRRPQAGPATTDCTSALRESRLIAGGQVQAEHGVSCQPAPGVTSGEARLREVLTAARAAVVAEAARRQTALGDLATTLVCAVAGPSGIAAAQVGDGAVVFGDREGQLRSLTRPLAGEYLNETVFLTSATMLECAQFQTWSGEVRHLAVFSDGLQMLALKMPEGTPHPPFFKPLFAWLARGGDELASRGELEAWLASPRVTDRTDDDLTLLLARRME